LAKDKPDNRPDNPPPLATSMSAEEKALQLEKIDLIKRMVMLLEEIAFRVTATRLEKPDYLKALYASSKR